MTYQRLGIILVTERYEECVAFYRDVLDLPLEYRLDEPGSVLTVFDYNGAYLMVEPGGPPACERKTIEQSPVKLRFNVTDIEAAAATLQAKGVSVDLQVYDWGTIADFTDPDGNLCSLRDVAGFGRGA